MLMSPRWNPVEGELYLFIFLVRPRVSPPGDHVDTCFCSVVVAAADAANAEAQAIARANGDGWCVLRTDTAARLPAHELTGQAECAAQLDELRRYGSAFWIC